MPHAPHVAPVDVILPWFASAPTDDGIGDVALNARTGFGDVLFGPFIPFEYG